MSPLEPTRQSFAGRNARQATMQSRSPQCKAGAKEGMRARSPQGIPGHNARQEGMRARSPKCIPGAHKAVEPTGANWSQLMSPTHSRTFGP
jgi:hypothetical protein